MVCSAKVVLPGVSEKMLENGLRVSDKGFFSSLDSSGFIISWPKVVSSVVDVAESSWLLSVGVRSIFLRGLCEKFGFVLELSVVGTWYSRRLQPLCRDLSIPTGTSSWKTAVTPAPSLPLIVFSIFFPLS